MQSSKVIPAYCSGVPQKKQLQDIEAGFVATVQKDLLRSSSLLIRWAKA
jgi:hypothetical protein